MGYLLSLDNRIRPCAKGTFLCCVVSVIFTTNIIGNYKNDSGSTEKERDLTWFCN